MRHLVLAMLMLTACGAVVLAAKDQPALAAEVPEQAAAAKKDEPAKKDDAKKDGAAKKDAGKPVNQFCVVERDSKIDPKITTTHDGKVIGFCCEGCLDTFKENPKKYMKDLK